MKETNLPETQLRSWQPRRPSAKLKPRIFSTAARHRSEAVLVIRWLAPATACALLALATIHQQNGMPAGTGPGESLIGSVLNNQSPVSDVVRDKQSDRNSFLSVTFDWTNRNAFTSSISSFLPGRMN